MTYLKILATATLLLVSQWLLSQQSMAQKEVLLIGTFHFNNPGADLAKTDKFDVMTKQSQFELNALATQISNFKPDKIFVEWDYDDAEELDSLYALYQVNKYFDHVAQKYPTNSFYKENEIFQLAFRIGKASKLPKVHGIDIQTDFPFDSLMVSIDRAKQTQLQDKISNRISEFEKIDNENQKKYSLTELILEKNTQATRDFDLGSYISLFNQAGAFADLNGPELVADWYKRNLFMYSFVQKMTEAKDQKIVVLLGSSHIALFKQFVDLDENFKAVELKDVLK